MQDDKQQIESLESSVRHVSARACDGARPISGIGVCGGVGNGTPLQYSCLENPRDAGAWWAAIYGVTQSQTRLKRLSGSNREKLGAWG